MTPKQIIFIISTVCLLAVGQVLIKLVAINANFNDVTQIQRVLFLKLCAAISVYATATLLWVNVLRITPLQLAYPFSALGFVFVPLLSNVWIGEPLRLSTFVGAAVIVVGVWISVGEN